MNRKPTMTNGRSPSFASSRSLRIDSSSSSMLGSSGHGRGSRSSFLVNSNRTAISIAQSQASQQRCCNDFIKSPCFRNTSLFLKKCIKSLAWKGMMTFFSLCLLFGSQIRHLWVPSSVDTACDIFSTITFSFFILDILMRSCVEPHYLNLNLWSTDRGQYGDTREKNFTCVLGSFLFWCDLLSTVTLLYDISFINKAQYDVMDIQIELNENGSPTHRFDSLHRFSIKGIKEILFLTILRSVRVARFVRSRHFINACNKVNWYWPFDQLKWLNPFFYRRKLRQGSKQTRVKNSLGIRGGEDAGSFSQPPEGKRIAPGVLQIGMPAEVKAREVASRLQQPRLLKKFKRMCRSMGLLESEHTLSIRNGAATKIQRAWRAHIKSVRVDGSTQSFQSLETPLNSISVSRRGTGNDFKLTPSGGQASRFHMKSGSLPESQVGSDMREQTARRVAFGVQLSLIFTVIFCYTEPSTTTETAMIVLHKQTQNSSFQKQILESTRDTSVPALFQYETADGVQFYFPLEGGVANGTNLKNRDKVRVSVIDTNNRQSVGWFSYRDEQMQDCLTSIVATFFIIFVWFFGVIAFSGPVIVLVVTPIERMVRLLGMLMLDPLGYQSTSRFKRFLREEDDLVKGTRWTKDVLKGMETSFLMSTILRIGSLMKVGFGTAGVEIIRNNLRKGQSKNVLILDSEGSTVSCIFLFCDIRQFTDATECLQEEVFVFTNRIAAVVHSICHAYGGAANKNVGDAFLLSWSLEDSSQEKKWNNFRSSSELTAKNNQGDKALLSVIKICLSLYYDKNYLEPLSEVARLRLKDKLLRKRTGPVVQMGFGLHAGKAVQGAIGSQRKIDATYVSEAVKRAEFLESETKTYGLKLLMSGSFHSLLHPNTRRRCRKVDRVYIPDEDGEGDDEYAALELSEEDLIHLYTFDMDVGAIYRAQQNGRRQATIDAMSDTGSTDGSRRKIDRTRPGFQIRNRSKRSLSNRYNTHYAQNQISIAMSEEFLLNGNVGSQTEVNTMPGGASVGSIPSLEEADLNIPPELVLPKGSAFYSHKIWQSPDIGRMRDKYIRGNFFQKYQTALTAFYNGDWDTARKNFLTVLDSFDDGPSRYFMEQMKEHNGVPPRDFMPYRKY